MYRRLAALAFLPLLLGQQCLELIPNPSGDQLPSPNSPRVTLQTSRGNIVIELFTQQGEAAAKFLSYFTEGYYDDAIFYEVQADQWIIGGAYTETLALKDSKNLVDESDNGLTNFRGRVAMINPPADGSPQPPDILINLTTNESLDFDGVMPAPFTVIGRVIEGMNVADEIGNLDTHSQTSQNGYTLNFLPIGSVFMNNAILDGDDGDEAVFITTSSGLKYRDVVVGTGELVTLDMTISVLYTGRLNDKDGKIFDQNTDRNNPVEFSLTGLIQGWQEGLSQYNMRVGGRRILIIPPDLGYGDQDQPDIPPNSTLYFDIEVLPGENDPPVANAGTDRTVVPDLVVTLDASESTDPDGDDLTYLWVQDSGETVEVDNATTPSATFTVPETTGTLVFTVTVDDGHGETNSESVELTITLDPMVRLETSMGDIVLSLLNAEDEAPGTSLNFLQYVEDGFYDGTIFHRVVAGFVAQGGGFLPGLIKQDGIRDPIVNEFSPDRSNIRSTVAMAKLGDDPDSATSQFFFNLVDNSGNLDTQNGGFTVFAEVSEGMDVVDAMAEVNVSPQNNAEGTPFDNVPVDDIVLIRATIE